MALHVHRAVDTDVLARGLAALLAQPLADPLVEELVVVPAKGIERWLTQRLSHHLGVSGRGRLDGVCAGVRFVSPSSLVSLLTGRPAAWHAGRVDDPYSPDRLTWTVLDVLDAHIDEPWLSTVARHLGRHLDPEAAALREGRRYALARHLAGLFSDYAVQRPGLPATWRRGELTGDEGDLAWQAELWRRVVTAVEAGVPDGASEQTRALAVPPDERHAAVVTGLRADKGFVDLPDRLSMFGHTRLAATEIDLLTALGEHRDVHLWLPQPSPAAWERLADADVRGVVPRTDDASAQLIRHPLLASLGRDSRELQRSLAGAGVVDHGHVARADLVVDGQEDAGELDAVGGRPAGLVGDLRGGGAVTGSAGAATPPATMLQMLQHDLAADAQADDATRARRHVDPDDRSIQVHAAHGPARQVEVLRDVITGLLEDDPTLEPRDILVMCPDVEAYAPLFAASFGLGEVGEFVHPAHTFRVRLADRSLVSTNPLFQVTIALLDLAAGRVTTSQVLDLASHPAVRRRFRFDDDALEKITAWVEEAGIRWGLDAEHRASYKLGAVSQNTWRTGLDRVLLGVAMAESLTDTGGGVTGRSRLGDVLPLDDVGSGDIDLVGRLVEFVDRMEAAIDVLAGADGVHAWMTALREAVTSLTAVSMTDAWQAAQLDRELAQVADSARTDTPMTLADVRRLLERRLAGRPTRANFRTGSITVCTMVPMRSVPHRVVALVGLDDGVFPRAESVDGDDVLARNPLTGERDRRSEDRQLLLDAVMAARDHLVITYTGASDLDGSARPPAVPVGELLDAVGGLAPGLVHDGECTVVTHHPLQPFDPRLLTAPDPFTFDEAAYDGAVALAGDRTPRAPFLSEVLPPHRDAEGDVALDDLQSFFANPARAFLRDRLDVTPLREDESDLDAMPVELDGLQTWGVGDRMLRDALAGVHPTQVVQAEVSRGAVPPGELGRRVVEEVREVVGALMSEAAAVRGPDATAVDVTVELGDGRRLTGTVTGIHGTEVVTLSYSSLSAKQRIRAWIDLLALTAAHPDVAWRSHIIARSRRAATHRIYEPLPPAMAAQWLTELVDIRDRGLTEPLPLPPKTALAYAEAAHRRAEVDAEDPFATRDLAAPLDAAKAAWETDRNRARAFPGEHADPSFAQVFGAEAVLDRLLEGSRPDEAWNQETNRLGRYAVRVWEPEITHGRRA